MNPPKWFGLLSLLLVYSFLVSGFPSQARATCVAHPTDPNAQFLGSFMVTIPLSSGGGNLLSGSCDVFVEACVWLVGGSRVEYVLNVGTMTFVGDCDMVDGMTFAEIMDQAAVATVSRGTTLSYTECGDTTDVWVGQCAERSGSGEETTFDPCNTAWCKRRYVIVCAAGGTTYQQLLEQPALCTGAGAECERGCTIVD